MLNISVDSLSKDRITGYYFISANRKKIMPATVSRVFHENTNWHNWHKYQSSIPIYLQFPSLFACRCESKWHWEQEDCISKL